MYAGPFDVRLTPVALSQMILKHTSSPLQMGIYDVIILKIIPTDLVNPLRPYYLGAVYEDKDKQQTRLSKHKDVFRVVSTYYAEVWDEGSE